MLMRNPCGFGWTRRMANDAGKRIATKRLPAAGFGESRQRIQRLELDERVFIRRTPEVEHERAVAIFDILEQNHFSPKGHEGGPYNLVLSLEDNRLVFDVSDQEGQPVSRFSLSLKPLRQVVKDYFLVCESYYSAIKTAPPSQIEAIDMGRRSLHNEGSEQLRETLAERIELDFDTARRLFTLLCVLHVRG